jgi:hypothetical protein
MQTIFSNNNNRYPRLQAESGKFTTLKSLVFPIDQTSSCFSHHCEYLHRCSPSLGSLDGKEGVVLQIFFLVSHDIIIVSFFYSFMFYDIPTQPYAQYAALCTVRSLVYSPQLMRSRIIYTQPPYLHSLQYIRGRLDTSVL